MSITVKKPKKNYISNKDFYAALVRYKDACKVAKEAGKQIPIIPNDIALCFMALSNNYAKKANFYHISFKEDMVSEAILTCVINVHKFDPSKSDNPFSYFTTAVHNAFLQRINKENRQQDIKKRFIKSMSESSIFLEDGSEGESNYVNHMQKQFDTFDMDEAKFGKQKKIPSKWGKKKAVKP